MHKLLLTALTLAAFGVQAAATAPIPDVSGLKKASGRFARVDLTADLSKLPANEQAVLAKLALAVKPTCAPR